MSLLNKIIKRSDALLRSDQDGAASIIMIMAIISASLLLLNFFSFSFVNSRKLVSNKITSQELFYTSEAGLEDNVYRIKNQKNYSASNVLQIGSGQTNITVTSNGSQKTILSEGVIGNLIRRIQTVVTLTTSEVSFHYGVQVGAGGLQAKNGVTIQGNIYSNGPMITNAGTGIVTGDAFVATAMNLDNSWTVQNNQTIFGEQSVNPNVFDVAQSFTPSTTGTLAQIDFYLKKNGNPGDVTVRILADNAGSPSKTVVASTTLSASLVTTSYGWVGTAFSTLPTLNAGTTYWVMLDTADGSNRYWYWGKDSNQGNGNGVSKVSADWNAATPVWTADAGDFNFKTWLGTGVNAIDNFTVYGNVHANTIIDTKVCGDAYYQTIDAPSSNFLASPTNPTCPNPLTPGTGYPASADPAVQTMPVSDGNITQWKSDASIGGTYSDAAHCTPANGAILGPAHLACDLTVTNGKTITIAGPIWVEGNILLDNNVKLLLDPSFGTSSAVIVADYPADTTLKGTIRTTNGVVICGSAGYNSGTGQCNPSDGSFIMMLSTYSGTSKALAIENNVEGGIFYAAYGSAELENNAAVKEIIAYKLELENNVTIVYESGLANANFTSGPGASWKINDWKEVE